MHMMKKQKVEMVLICKSKYNKQALVDFLPML